MGKSGNLEIFSKKSCEKKKKKRHEIYQIEKNPKINLTTGEKKEIWSQKKFANFDKRLWK